MHRWWMHCATCDMDGPELILTGANTEAMGFLSEHQNHEIRLARRGDSVVRPGRQRVKRLLRADA